MGAFDDLMPGAAPAAGVSAAGGDAFADLVPKGNGSDGTDGKNGSNAFSDLMPNAAAAPVKRNVFDDLFDMVVDAGGHQADSIRPLVNTTSVIPEGSLTAGVKQYDAKGNFIPSDFEKMVRPLATPQNAAITLATAGGGSIAKLAAAGFGAMGAKGLYDAGKVIADPNADTDAKHDATLSIFPNLLMVGAGVHGVTAKTGAPVVEAVAPVAKLPAGEVSEFGGVSAPEAPSTNLQAPENNQTPSVQTSGSDTSPPAPLPDRGGEGGSEAGATSNVAGVPVQRVGAEAITTRPDLMQFKRMDDEFTGVNADDKLKGKWDDLKAGNLLLWEPKDPAQYGLDPGEKYIVANGHHRFEFGDENDVPDYNAQVIREADRYSAQDARALAAEVNIADGKGTIYDAVKFLRNESATHGADAAVARAGRIGIKGGQASTIAFAAGPDLYTSFVNEQVRPEQAEAIARSAPVQGPESDAQSQNAGLQRLGIKQAIDGASPGAINNLMQAVKLEARNVPAQQFDLFAADDSAIKTAQNLASVATRIQNELSREIRSTDAAARNATTAKAKGIQFERDPAAILAENAQLKGERDRWNNWALHPELVKQVRDYAEMGRRLKGETAAEAPSVQPPTPSEAPSVKVIQDETAATGSRYIYATVDGQPWVARLATHEPGQTKGGNWRVGERELKAATGKDPYNLDWRVRDPEKVSPEQVAKIVRQVATPEFLAEEANIAQVHGQDNPELASYDPASGKVTRKKLNTAESEASRTIGGSLKNAPNQIQTESRMVSGGNSEPGVAGIVKPTLDEKLQSLKIDTQGKLLEGVTSIPIHLWNASIDVVRAAVAGGKLLNDAVQSGVDWLKQNHPAVGFDEQEYRKAVLDQYGTREFGRKLQADPDVAPAVKAQAREYIYQRRGNESDLQSAQRIVQEHGVDGATALLKDSQAQMPGAVRSMLGQFLVKSLADHERTLRANGDTAGAEAMVARQVDVGDTVLKLSTDLAQSLQAFSVFGKMSPQGMLAYARSQFKAFGDRVMNNVQGPAELIRHGLNEANQQATDAVKADPTVNAAVRTAVDHAVGISDTVRKGVIVEIAGAMAESPEVVKQARAALAGRLNEVLKAKPGGLANASKAQLGVELDGLAKRAAGIASNHYQGAEPGKPLAVKFQERLGLGPEASKRLAASMDLVFGSMVKKAAERIPWRVAEQRAKINQPFKPGEVLPGSVDAEIRRQLMDMNLKLGNLVKQHSRTVDATGRTIGARVVADSGLTGPHADALRQAFDARWQALSAAAREQMLKRIGKQQVIPRQLKGAIPELLKLSNLGAFDDAKYYDVLKRKLGLPQLTPDVATEIVRRANAVQGLPEGFQRDRGSAQLLNYIASQKPLKIWDLPMAMWYANTLSGFSTPVHIMFDNMNSLAGTSAVSFLRNPTAMLEGVNALGRGLVKGTQHAGEILKTGVVTDVKSGVHTSPLLELDPFKGPLGVLNYWKYVGRTLSATHVLMFKPAMELRQALAARQVAVEEGLRGDMLRSRVDDLLANTAGKVTAARAQAATEGLTGLDLSRRTNEILEQQREAAMPGSTDVARDFALRSTYLNEPYGALGHVTKGINDAIAGFGKDHPKLGFVPRMMVPFTRIVGNIVNEKLNWSPVGTLRAMKGFQTGELYGKPVSDARAPGDLMAKSILGTTATVAVATMAAQYLNDPDPKFAITGNGPADADKRKQLTESGWHPHSVKIGGEYFDYTRTPMAIELAALGNYLDGVRYKHLDNADALNRVAIVLKGTGDTIVHQSFLDSIANMFEALGDQNVKTGGQKLEATMARTVSGLAVPNLVSQVDRFFDPTKYDATDTAGMLRQQIPFVRRQNDPVLNALGEPMKMGVFDRDFGSEGTDPVWRLLAVKQAWIPAARDEVIGNKKLGPDHYRALTSDEQYALTAESGPKIRERIEGQFDRLANMPDDQARKVIAAITVQERQRALAKMR